jgi:hypothetical protein
VEVAVSGPVARVEIRLDGRTVGAMDQAPWRVDVDFGEELLPHELVAVAYDQSDRELHRTRQLVNAPRDRFEIRIALERDASDMPAAAHVVWQSASNESPRRVHVSFDGRALKQVEDGRFPLPAYDPKQIHIVSADATFRDGIHAHSDVTFGGIYGSEVKTELTAVPIEIEDPQRPPSVAGLEGAFVSRGRPLQAAAVTKTGAKIYVVKDTRASSVMQRFWAASRPGRWQGRSAHGCVGSTDEILTDSDQLLFVTPKPSWERLPGGPLAVYPVGGPYSYGENGLLGLIMGCANIHVSKRKARIADAVAVAGVRAAATRCPRAVLLLVPDDPADVSQFDPELVGAYLRSISVPLYVWSVGPTTTVTGWGEATDVSSRAGFAGACELLAGDIGRQWVVWLEGNLLPNRIEVAGRPAGFRLAGQEWGKHLQSDLAQLTTHGGE